MNISNSVKKRFVKDYNLPITLFRNDIFEYFMDLYDAHMGTGDKWNKLLEVIDVLGGEEGYFNESSRIINEVTKEISEHPEYARIQSMVLPVSNAPTIEKRNIYHPDFVGKLLISIDMRQANFNSLRFLSPELLRNADNYGSYLKNFTKHDYYLDSKQIRQVIFGNLNPKRQQSVQKYIMSETLILLLREFGDVLDVITTGPDEIIIVYNNSLGVYVYDIIDKIVEALDGLSIKNCHKIHPFILEKVEGDKPFYVKIPYDIEGEISMANGLNIKSSYNSSEVEFKGVPSFFYAQVFKKYFKLPANDFDFLFYHEGHYAKFMSSVFEKFDAN